MPSLTSLEVGLKMNSPVNEEMVLLAKWHNTVTAEDFKTTVLAEIERQIAVLDKELLRLVDLTISQDSPLHMFVLVQKKAMLMELIEKFNRKSKNYQLKIKGA